MKKLQHILLLGLASLLVFACQSPSSEDLPDDLAELRQMQKEKRAEIRIQENELEEIEKKIAELDSNDEQRVSLVTVDTLIKEDFDHYVEVQGRVESRENVRATSEIGGQVTRHLVEEGQMVNRGQLIAKVDVESLSSQRNEIQSQLDLARDVFNRQKRLWDQGIGSEVEYLQAKNRVENLEQSLNTIEVNLKKANVYAPKSGIVDEVFIKEGEYVAPGAPIVSIIDHKRLKVKMEVPENYLGKIEVGDVIDVKFPSIDYKQKAKVSLIGSTINPNNRTFIAEAHIQADKKGLIRPNMLAVGLVNDYHQDTVIQVPVDLVQQEVGGKDYVYVQGMSEKGPVAVKKYVEVGKVYSGNAEIRSGLKEGQVLIMAGARGLAENERINIQESGSNSPLEKQ